VNWSSTFPPGTPVNVKRPWPSVVDVMFVPETVTLIDDGVPAVSRNRSSHAVEADAPAPVTTPVITAPAAPLVPVEGPSGDNEASAPHPAAVTEAPSANTNATIRKLDIINRSPEQSHADGRKSCSTTASAAIGRKAGHSRAATVGISARDETWSVKPSMM
jgi:hypothetical protein